MQPETRQCQSCKQNFRIDPEDFVFYEKIKVPAPTFCPECRLQRRLMFRNERSLYRKTCALCGKNMISVFSQDKPYTVYCNTCWWSDKWDASEYAMEYDSGKNFFEQLQELEHRVPCMPLIVEAPSLINSEYVNHAGYQKNCYLVFNADYNENCCYLDNATRSKECAEGIAIHNSELCYESINIEKSHSVYFSEDIEASHSVYFSKNLNGCTNCFGCVNLRNKQYCFLMSGWDVRSMKGGSKSIGSARLRRLRN